MRRVTIVFLLSLLIGITCLSAEDKPTSLLTARAAVDVNMATPEGKAYDEKFGAEFSQKHLSTLRQCKQSAGNDLGSFWFLFRLDKDGAVKEVLLYPATKLGTCARGTLLKSSFASPPHPEYWVSVYLKLAH